jgi:hypothetical protein
MQQTEAIETENWYETVALEKRETKRMKKHTQDLAEAPRGCSQVGITIGIDLGDVWSHYCTLNEDGEVVDRGRFRTNPSSVGLHHCLIFLSGAHDTKRKIVRQRLQIQRSVLVLLV